MSKLFSPTLVKFFVSVLFNTKKFSQEEIVELLAPYIPSPMVFTPKFNPLLEYYSKEMGDSLSRVIIYTHVPQDREKLVDLKLWATTKEIETSVNDKRSINLDIGFVAKEQVVLATGKPYSHRIYLQQGVYAELVYFYKDKSFQKVPWTYPDYQSDEKVKFFNSIR